MIVQPLKSAELALQTRMVFLTSHGVYPTKNQGCLESKKRPNPVSWKKKEVLSMSAIRYILVLWLPLCMHVPSAGQSLGLVLCLQAGINYLSKVERLSAFGHSHALIIKPHHLASCFVGHMLFVPRALWLLYYVSLWQSRPSSQALGTPCAVEWLIALRHEDPLMVSPWHRPILQLRSHPFQNSKDGNWKAKLTDMPIGLRGDCKHTCKHADYMSSVHMVLFLRQKKEREKKGKKQKIWKCECFIW